MPLYFAFAPIAEERNAPMQLDELSEQLKQQTQAQHAELTGDGYQFQAVVVSDVFEGLMPLKRHQKVYAVLDEQIKSGDIHALSIKAYTPSEWEKLKA